MYLKGSVNIIFAALSACQFMFDMKIYCKQTNCLHRNSLFGKSWVDNVASFCVNSVNCSGFLASDKFSMWRHKGVAVVVKSLAIRWGIWESPMKGTFLCNILLIITCTNEALSYNFLSGTGEGLKRLEGWQQQGYERGNRNLAYAISSLSWRRLRGDRCFKNSCVMYLGVLF